MRPILVSDVLCLARALVAVPEIERCDLVARLIEETVLADRFRQQFGTSHPVWGDGSISARCLLTRPPPEPGPDNAAHLAAIAMSALALARMLIRTGR